MSRKLLTLLSVLTVALGGCALNPLKLLPQKDMKERPAEAKRPPRPPRKEDDPAFWRADGQAILAQAQKPADGRIHARNVILFIGEGMGVSTVTAARILAGQSGEPPKGQKPPPNGEEAELAFERFPATALAKTYNTDLQTPDSAGAMSAILTGVKTRGSSLALDPVPSKGQCAEAADHETATLLEQAKAVGLSTGLVTTARVTYPAAAATYAHLSDPDWEVDAVIPDTPTRQGCRDIARQLADQRRGLDIVLGGGRLAFLPNTKTDPYDSGRRGVRRSEEDLVAVWLKNNNGRYLTNASQLKNVNWKVDRMPILGLFAPDHMHYEAERATSGADEPSLTEMTVAAIKALQRNPRGYVLVVDAAGIGRAHRDGNAYNALNETRELSRAVDAAAELTGAFDTLILVTAEHGDTLTIGGPAKRGNPILSTVSGVDGEQVDAQGRPYTTLVYGAGPARKASGERLTPEVAEAPDYRQAAGVTLAQDGVGGGEDVPVYARGPGSQWVRGSLDQHALYWVMRAAVLGQPPAPKKKGLLPKVPNLNPFAKKKPEGE